MTVTELPPAEVNMLRENLKSVIAKYTATVGEPLMTEEVQAEMARCDADAAREPP